MQQKMKVAYFYSGEDAGLVRRFDMHFKSYAYSKNIEISHRGGVRSMHTEKEDKLYAQNAQIVLIFLSSSFLANGLCYENLLYALEEQKNEKVIVIFLIIRPCDFHSLIPDNYTMAFPTNNSMIPKKEDNDDAWLNLINEIDAAIKSIENEGNDLDAALKNSAKKNNSAIEKKTHSKQEVSVFTDKPITIFLWIYYNDRSDLESQIRRHISPIEKQYNIVVSSERYNIYPGDTITEVIKELVLASQIILLILDSNLLSIDDNYLDSEDHYYSIKKLEIKSKFLLPILFDYCLWENDPFFMHLKHVNELPLRSKKWNGIDNGIQYIGQKIIKTCEQFRSSSPEEWDQIVAANNLNFIENELDKINNNHGISNVNIWLYYSERDQEQGQHLINFLRPILGYKNVVIGGSIEDYGRSPGEPILPEDEERIYLSEKISKIQIAVPLLSADFLDQEYGKIQSEIIFQQQQLGKLQVLPIVLRPCLWEHTKHSNYINSLQDKLPINSDHWDTENEFYYYNSKKIVKAIYNWQNPDFRIAYQKIEDWYRLPQEVLDLRGLNLTKIPENIFGANISELLLDHNQLTEFPDSLQHCLKLKKIYASNNQIQSLPEWLADLPFLEVIDISYNNIQSIEGSLNRVNSLTEIIANSNLLKEIPDNLLDLPNLKTLDIADNPLPHFPIEILKGGLSSLRAYYTQKRKSVYEAKVIVVGRGAVGKTSLIKKLTQPNIVIQNTEEIRTEGIDINIWKYRHLHQHKEQDFIVNFWDFGGQEIYHATHQFFLNQRAVYLLVWEWDERKSETDANLMRWLYMIKALGGNSPVIMVMNKMDKGSKELNQEIYSQKFSNIKAYQKISVWGDINLQILSEVIKQTVTSLPSIGEEIPVAWIALRDELLQSPDNYISFKDFSNIAKGCGLETSDYLSAAKFYHELGIILYFDKDITLKKTIFLKPSWITSAVYKVLDSSIVKEKGGKFLLTDLNFIWDDEEYQQVEAELIQLMVNFEICFSLGNENEKKYIVPELLTPLCSIHDWDDKKVDFVYEYHYELMPSGLFGKFLTRIFPNIEQDLFWKEGVILRHKDIRAKVIANIIDNKIVIAVTDAKSYLIEKIKEEFDFLHQRLSNLVVKEMIPCVCEECIKNNYNGHYFDYQKVLLRHSKSKKNMICEISTNDVPIAALLNKAQRLDGNNEFSKKPNRENALKIFYSYAEEDEEYLIELKKHLSPLKKTGFIDDWSSNDALGGSQINSEIEQNLSDADIVLMLISANFLSSKYFDSKEVEMALQQYKKGSKLIIPILLKACLWENTGLSELKCLPDNNEPIFSKNWYVLGDAFYNVAVGIKNLTDDFFKAD